MTPEDFSVRGNILHEDDGWAEQIEFRSRVQADFVIGRFSNPAEVALKVVTAVRNWERRDLPKPFSSKRIDCILLGGGFAKRLWPLTSNYSKHLLPVAGKPVLAYALDFLLSSRSIGRVYLITSARFEHETASFLSDS